MSRYLLDASALYPLLATLKSKAAEHIEDFAILDLTPYEVGNALWKEHKKGRVKNLEKLSRIFKEILDNMKTINTKEHWNNILRLAARENLTFYDAAYLHTARAKGLTLVTQDKDLLKYSDTTSPNNLIKNLKNRKT